MSLFGDLMNTATGALAGNAGNAGNPGATQPVTPHAGLVTALLNLLGNQQTGGLQAAHAAQILNDDLAARTRHAGRLIQHLFRPIQVV